MTNDQYFEQELKRNCKGRIMSYVESLWLNHMHTSSFNLLSVTFTHNVSTRYRDPLYHGPWQIFFSKLGPVRTTMLVRISWSLVFGTFSGSDFLGFVGPMTVKKEVQDSWTKKSAIETYCFEIFFSHRYIWK